jgi:hypothetical protein
MTAPAPTPVWTRTAALRADLAALRDAARRMIDRETRWWSAQRMKWIRAVLRR